MRRFAFGDIHGCYKPLRTLIDNIDPQQEDELIFLGDYVDRGPDSRGVVDLVIELQQRCKVVSLRGNHEIMLLSVAKRGCEPEFWYESGGQATINSYGGSVEKIPSNHMDFFERLQPFYETDEEIFVHANYEPHLPMDEQSDDVIFWRHLKPPLPMPHVSGKRVIVGHTPQPFGQIFNHGYLVGIDTYCFGHGFLTAFDLSSDELLQADYHGHMRRFPGRDFKKWVRERARVLAGWIAKRKSKTAEGEAKDPAPSHSE